MMKKNLKLTVLLFNLLTFTACINTFTTDKIKGQAIIIDNFKDKNPLERLYIEVKYTNDEGYTFNSLSGSATDENGYFEIDTEYKTGLLSLDSWAIANVYTDINQSEKLGSFGFQFPKHTYDYMTIHLDTFSLPHNIWVIPVIKDLGSYQPDEISIDFYNCDVVDTSNTNMTFRDSFTVNQTLNPVEIKMTMNIQHWLTYGSGELARGSLKINNEEIGFGYFRLEEVKHSSEGDVFYLNFTVEKD